MADRLVSVDDNFDFPEPVALRQAAIYAPSNRRGDSWDTAWRAKDVSVLRAWFRANTGPRVPVASEVPVVGEVIIGTQSDAAALRGKQINGHLIVTASDIELSDFIIMGDGAEFLIRVPSGIRGVYIHDFEIDGQRNYGTTRGISSSSVTPTANGGVVVERGDLHGLCDGIGGAGGSTIRHCWIHDPILWDDAVDGTYLPSRDPHSDGVQVSSGRQIRAERNFIEMVGGGAPNIVSGMIFNSKSGPIDGVTIRENYLAGGGYTLSFIEDGNGHPTNVLIDGNRFGGGYTLGLMNYDPAHAPTLRYNTWADSGRPIPVVVGATEKYPIRVASDPMALGYVATYLSPGGGTIWGAANDARYLRALSPGQVSRIAIDVTASVGNISVGIYRGQGGGMSRSPGELVASATIPCPPAGFAFIDLSKKVDVRTGDYLAMSCDNATAAFVGFTGGNSLLFGSQFYRSADSFPLPAKPALLQTGGYRMPILVGAT